MKKIVAAILALLLSTLACSRVEVKTPAVSTSNASPTLFSDDFSNRNSGWDRYQDITGVTDYSNVGYLIHVKTANSIKWANPSKTFQNNVRIEVDATKATGPDDNAFGIICRYQDIDNFYYFYISSDGFAGIGKKVYGYYIIISSPDGKLLEIKGINKGAATNHLRADCIGNTLTFYVNDIKAAQATANYFTGGDVGLIARSYDTGGADIQFNHFLVVSPDVRPTPDK
jgi:hypothetical protein